MSLITKDDIKNYLSITASTWDTIITDYISKTTYEIYDMIGQSIESETKDVIFKGNGDVKSLLVNCPITQINSLSYRSSPTESWVAIGSTEYTLYESEYVYWIYYNTFNSSYQYKANIDYGYTTIPEPIKMIAIEMTVDKLLNSRLLDLNEGFRHGLNSRSDSINGISGTTGFKTPDYWHRLGKYFVVLK